VKKGRPWLVPALAALLALVVIVVVWSLLQIESAPYRLLPGGGRLVLEAVSYETPVMFIEGPAWKKRLYPALPTSLRQRLGLRTVTTSARPGCVGVTLRRSGLGRAAHAAMLLDSHGCASSPRHQDDGPEATTYHFPLVPRDQPELRLQVLSPTRVPIGPPFLFSNPAFGPCPSWVPESYPVSRRSGTFRVVIDGWTLGDVPDNRNPYPGRPQPLVPGSLVSYRITDSVGLPIHWRPISVSISDAGGGTWRYFHRLRQQPYGSILLPVGLCREATAYRVKIGWAPISWSEPRMFTLKDLSLPQLQRPRKVRLASDLTAVFSAVPYPRGRPSVQGVVTSTQPGLGLMVGVAHRGRTYATGAEYAADAPATQPFRIWLSKETGRFDLIFYVRTPHFTEFQIKPGSRSPT